MVWIVGDSVEGEEFVLELSGGESAVLDSPFTWRDGTVGRSVVAIVSRVDRE